MDSSAYPVSHLLETVVTQYLKSNDLNTTETSDFPTEPEELGWQWIYSPETCRDHSAADIATQLSYESSSKMTEIPFAAWINRAMGRESPSYEYFRRQHLALRDRIQKHVTACQDLGTYHKVKRALRDQSPFARWAVAMATSGPWQPQDPFPEDRVDFLVKPIKRTLCDWKEKERDVQKQICLLAIRYRLSYPDGDSFARNEDFNTDTTLLERLLYPQDPQTHRVSSDASCENTSNDGCLDNAEESAEHLQPVCLYKAFESRDVSRKSCVRHLFSNACPCEGRARQRDSDVACLHGIDLTPYPVQPGPEEMTRSRRIEKYMGREMSPSQIWVTAKMLEHVQNPPNSITDVLVNYRTVRMSWSEFRKTPGARDALGQKDWEALEGQAVRNLLEGLIPEEAESSWGLYFPCF